MASELNNKCDCMILNFWACTNYGAILTCYGVKCLMEKLGKNTKVINYFPKPIFKHKYKNSFTQHFAEKYLNLTTEICNYKDFQELNNFADIFIAGSDQIWNSEIARTHHENATDAIYLLDFVKNSKKKLAYSASFGVDYFNGNQQEKANFMHFLNRFDGISVRENAGVEIIEKIFHHKAFQAIDGAFHIPKEILDNLTKDFRTDEKYIGCYVLPYFSKDKWYKDKLKTISEKLNLPIKTLPFNSKTSMEEWLSFIKNSEFMITDSYHATVFSLIFNKPFIQIVNAKAQNRFVSLYKLLSIKNPTISKDSKIINYDEIINNFNWSLINNCIAKEVKKAEEWVEGVLASPKTSNYNDDAIDYIITDSKIREKQLNEKIILLTNKNKIFHNYYKYKIFSKIAISKKKREHYKFKKKIFKNKVIKIRELEKMNTL